MKVFELTGRSGADALALVERPSPVPQHRELLVRIRAASLNYRDLAVMRHDYGSFPRPLVPLSDGAGEVVAVGPGATRFAVGDRVVLGYIPDWLAGPPSEAATRRRLGGPLDGTATELLAISEDAAVAIPAHLSFAEAATLPIAGVTAWRALFEIARVQPGETVVIQGTGGVSLFALTLARLAGATAIVTSSSDAKLARAAALGAAHGINYRTTPAWDAQVRQLTGGRGADHVIDVAGGPSLDRSIGAVRLGGTVVLVGFVTGTATSLDLTAAIRRAVRLEALSGGSRHSLEALAAALAAHQARPVIDRAFAFDQLRAALDHLAGGDHLGKIVVTLP